MLDLTGMEKALKIKYSPEAVVNEAYQEEPFLALVPKSEKFGGKSFQYALIVENPQAGSSTFADGWEEESNSDIDGFNVTRVSYYSFARIDGETLEASANDEDAMLEALETEIDGALASAKINLSTSLFRKKSGTVGKIAAGGITGNVVTLEDPNDIVNFANGMTVSSSTTDGSGAAKSQSSKIVSMDRILGKFTLADATGFAAADYLFRKGNYNKSISGLADWIPVTDPSGADNFFGTNRSRDRVRLAGNVLSAVGKPLTESMVKGAGIVGRNGGKISHYIMNDENLSDVIIALGAKVVYTEYKVGDIGFEAIKVHTPKGSVTCVSDRNCPANLMYGLTMSTWQLRTLGKCVRFFDYTGKMLTMSNKDAVEARTGYRGNLLCKAPAHNIVIVIK